jgi:NDP-sugar pyrophosphorylase family protein
MSGEILTLVVLAAGTGTRYGGLKQLVGVGPGGETLMDYSVYDAVRAGFTRVAFVIRPDMETAFHAFAEGRYGEEISVSTTHQRLEDIPGGFVVPVGRAKPWGTAHATLAAEPAVSSPFVVVNADDFYGAPAFRTAAAFLGGAPSSVPPAWAIVGYRLRDTLSEAGGVSRAVCGTDTDGWLTTIEEVHGLAASGFGFTGTAEGRSILLQGDEPVSMNIWAFTPDVFGLLRRGLVSFLHQSDLEKSEYLLPTIVQDAIRAGEARVRVLEAGGSWYGMTYPADKPRVEAALLRLHREGHYPAALWT